jgi:hypothetical protein
VGVYWSPGQDEHWISYYEVRRGEKKLDKVAVGTYFFDHSPGWNPETVYAVRTVDGEGQVSPWRPAESLANEPWRVSALGGHFSEAGREGWLGETTTDLKRFLPMHWVPPARWSAGDANGTANQVGGAEGYWEGDGAARVGRGWQQASPSCSCVRTWKAPKGGTIRIIGRPVKEFYRYKEGVPLGVRILHGTHQVWPASGAGAVLPGDLTGPSHDFTLSVSEGDLVRFVLEKADRPGSALIAWMPLIEYPEKQPSRPPGQVVRILCGSEKPYADSCGNNWSADAFFSGGRPFLTRKSIAGSTPTPRDQNLYQCGRAGAVFTYTLPVPTGLYRLRLKFAEPEFDSFFQRPFNLEINGQPRLNNFDIAHAARGPCRAYERVFRYLAPDAQGQIVLRFRTGWEPRKATDEALLQALELVPEDGPVMRIDTGSTQEFIDWNGFAWEKDGHFEGGSLIRADGPVAQASPTLYDQELYRTARAGQSFRYRIPLPPGLYTVHLKFAELWQRQVGQRPMHIDVNGCRVREAWDPATAAGQVGMAADLRVEDIAPDRQGRITIEVKAAGASQAILQGLEIY